MPGKRRGQVTRAEIVLANWQQEELSGFGGRRQPSMGGTSRVTGDGHARICEGLGVKVPGATRPKVGQGRVCTSKTKAFSFTHRTKVIAGSTVRKNSV
jgi:hypothetical protein